MELDVEIGTYTHVATSLHLYSADREKLKEAFGDSND
jgi:thymidylate synthase